MVLPMPLIGIINAGKTVDVRFLASQTNTGVTVIPIGWVPRSPGDPVPQPTTQTAAPGTSGTPVFSESIPRTARQLRITIQLPSGGSGTLEVRENGRLVTGAPEPVTANDIYTLTVLA